MGEGYKLEGNGGGVMSQKARGSKTSGMIILTVSDIVVPFIYSPMVRDRFAHVDLVIGCGDLPYYYLEYIISSLNVPLYYVRGNHDKEIEYGVNFTRNAPEGAINLHRRLVREQGLLIAGVEGSLRYRPGPYQYTQGEMWYNVLSLVPRLLINKALYGRYLDVFVTHAPPRGVHDQEDLTHRGINAYRWLIRVFRPSYYYHGHIHVIKPGTEVVSEVDGSQVINTYGYRLTEIQLPDPRRG